MQLVNEENDGARALFNFFEHGFEAVFKLATILSPRNHRAEIERDYALVLKLLGYVAENDALREAFDNGRFAHAGLADEHRVVLGTSREHLYGAADFFIAANHRVEFATPRQLGQVASITLQRLVLGFWILVGHSLVSSHSGQRLE